MKLLVHTCCAPCLVYINKYLKENQIDYDSLYYNPNIHPYKEYVRRLKTLEEFTKNEQVKLIHEAAYLQEYYEKSKNNCDFCYNNRLEFTAKYASKHGYTHFTSTLLISPYQDHDKMIKISHELEEKYKVIFFYCDFRDHFREGQNMARDLKMYKQKYCGCINSYNSSKFKDKIHWD